MQTRYPLLLVHGLGMKDNLFIRSFGWIDRLLRIQGYHVFISRIDSMGTIESNAAQLKAEILSILEKEQTDKVNIIAHSKGGLDAKYMIMNL
ncbi:MAG: triacylglycerol lipase, partial [Clostridia bacterium]|nr:triacylglycerol lipase [Clostridia bacterium]MBR6808710.1 triacylglycerol lipase [Clostridia bacterium]